MYSFLKAFLVLRNEMVSMASAHVQFLITERKRFWSCFDVASAIGELQSKR